MVILDFLRGFAIFGILIVNMSWYNAPLFAQMGDNVLFDDTANNIARLFIQFFFEGKFYPLFSMLFGIGFYIFMQKAGDTIRPVMFRYRMRLLYLLLFGVLHVVFLWHSDILVFYALFGFVMTWFYKRSDKTIIIWAVIFILLPSLIITLMVVFLNLGMQIPEVADQIERGFSEQNRYVQEFIDKALVVYATGSFSEIVRIRLTDYLHIWNGILFAFPNVVSLFLLGLYAGRKNLFRDIPDTLKRTKKLFYWCLPLGIVLNALYTYVSQTADHMIPGWDTVILLTSSLIGGPALMFVYVYLLAMMYHKGVFRKIGNAVCNVGRMAFTNYLTQSIICTTIMFSYGLGLYGQINYWQGIILTIAIYIVQLIWSHYWLKHYRFGPFEWLWRSLTYAKWQSMRRKNS